MTKSVDEDSVIDLYNELYTIRHIAELVGVDHHRVKRILIKNNITLIDRKTKRPKRVVSEHTRKLISEKLKGRKKNPHLDSTRMKISITNSQIGLSSDTAKSYPNVNKTLFLIKLIKKNTISRGYKISSVFLSSFINKFYNDVPFNSMYDDWILNKKNKWYRPSLDHILSISKYRNFDMDNMRIITWFENRSKSNMHINYWENFKQNFEIKSKLFIENDHILYDQNIDINEGISKANYQYFRDYIQTDEERRKNFIQKYDNSIPISALNKYENFKTNINRKI